MELLAKHPMAEDFSVTVAVCCDDLYDMFLEGKTFEIVPQKKI